MDGRLFGISYDSLILILFSVFTVATPILLYLWDSRRRRKLGKAIAMREMAEWEEKQRQKWGKTSLHWDPKYLVRDSYYYRNTDLPF